MQKGAQIFCYALEPHQRPVVHTLWCLHNLWDCAKTAYAASDTFAVDLIMLAQLPPEGLEHFDRDPDIEHLDLGWESLTLVVFELAKF